MSTVIEKMDALILFHREEARRLLQKREEYLKAKKALVEAVQTDTDEDLRKNRPSNKTIKEHVLEILRDEPTGLHWQAILKELHTRYSPTLARTSLSPQLSRLKQEAKIDLLGGKWLLIEPDLLPASTTSFSPKPKRKLNLRRKEEST